MKIILEKDYCIYFEIHTFSESSLCNSQRILPQLMQIHGVKLSSDFSFVVVGHGKIIMRYCVEASLKDGFIVLSVQRGSQV